MDTQSTHTHLRVHVDGEESVPQVGALLSPHISDQTAHRAVVALRANLSTPVFQPVAWPQTQ